MTTVTPHDVARVVELIHGDGSIPDKIRRIHSEMPHLTVEDIQKIATTDSEMLCQDAAVQMADANATMNLAEILKEAQAMSGSTQPLDLVTASNVLIDRVAKGDARAQLLLDALTKALPVVGVSD